MRSDDYLAGLFDGEGWISASSAIGSHGKPYTRLIVGIGMRHQETVHLFKARFGGSVKTYVDKLGRKIHQWYLCGAKARPVLEVLSQKCFLKKAQADLALQLVNFIEATHGRRVGRRFGKAVIDNDERQQRARIVVALGAAKKYADA